MVTKALVVGSGCIGLRTALELLKKQVKVIIRSTNPPLHSSTCSQGAGGLWMPFHCEDERVDRWANETLTELLKSSKCIEIVPAISLHKHNHLYPKNDLPEWTKDTRLKFQAMSLEMLSWQNQLYKLRIPDIDQLQAAGYLYNWLFFTPIVNPPQMLQKMYEEVISHPLAIDVNVNMGKEYESIDEMINEAIEKECDTVINCTGLGARKLCMDNNLTGARGILYHYDRANCVRNVDPSFTKDAVITTEVDPWGIDGYPCYMIPRGDVLVVGGSYLEGDSECNIREKERKHLERNAQLLGIDTEKSKPINEWTGFRPARSSGVRLEIDDKFGLDEGVRVIHNYGHGGSGWTVYVGAAKEVANLLGI